MIKLILDYEEYFTHSYAEFEPMTAKKTVISLDDQKLDFVAGQRGTQLLRINGYCYARNNRSADTTYWVCRTRVHSRPCNARAMTTLKSNGLYRIIITNPVHIHAPQKQKPPGKPRKERPKVKVAMEEYYTFEFDASN